MAHLLRREDPNLDGLLFGHGNCLRLVLVLGKVPAFPGVFEKRDQHRRVLLRETAPTLIAVSHASV
jgi:hypothetical protein